MKKNELIKKLLDSEEQEIYIDIIERDTDGFVTKKMRVPIEHIRTTISPLAICVEASKIQSVETD